ncbi:MAG: hypothetical protein HWD82_01940 [Flavobacteriaceae bacterium]|nr:hypothetical protein [Flavobacteriaceae bacterium]
MQDPFEDLPSDILISSISYSIKRGLLQLIEKNVISEPPVSGKFWIK